MKTIITTLALFASLVSGAAFAQDRTTVNAMSYDISDNLDLRAVASIFGDSENLEDFERRLNDPKLQISNLDLNRDNQVDYLRVIESVEGNTHLVIIQSVLDRDVYQDVATVEVERDRNNNVQVQVVGDVYMYGPNYIYEPVYVQTPVFYNYFWAPTYHPYHSGWYWGYYPSYYYAWNPYPVYRYQNNIIVHINTHNHYNYVNTRRSVRAASLYSTRRSNGYERLHPQQTFEQRNNGMQNRQALVAQRTERSSSRSTSTNASRSTTPSTRSYSGTRSASQSATARTEPRATSVRSTTSLNASRATSPTTRSTSTASTSRNAASPRSQTATSTYRSASATPARTESSATRSSATRNTTAPTVQRTSSSNDRGFTGAGAQMRNGTSRQTSGMQSSQRSSSNAGSRGTSGSRR